MLFSINGLQCGCGKELSFKKWEGTYMNSKVLIIFVIIMPILFTTCASTSNQPKEEELTVGIVQREIKIGMSAAEVAEELGSPNIVTTDEERREVWLYDKISSEVSYEERSGYGTLILIGWSGSSGSKETSQKTLTIIIKFDEDNKVRDFAYHASRF